MLGQGVEHDVVPYFFSDLADWASFEYVGPGSGELVVRGSMDDGNFSAFFVEKEQGHVVSALSVGRGDDLEHARRFISERTKPDADALADEDTDLSDL
jgi:3-phenylpropionate/trans-cinnamate dioxygenase ferredoxin reductase subunit